MRRRIFVRRLSLSSSLSFFFAFDELGALERMERSSLLGEEERRRLIILSLLLKEDGPEDDLEENLETERLIDEERRDLILILRVLRVEEVLVGIDLSERERKEGALISC
jgi:hypothetical protein